MQNHVFPKVIMLLVIVAFGIPAALAIADHVNSVLSDVIVILR